MRLACRAPDRVGVGKMKEIKWHPDSPVISFAEWQDIERLENFRDTHAMEECRDGEDGVAAARRVVRTNLPRTSALRVLCAKKECGYEGCALWGT